MSSASRASNLDAYLAPFLRRLQRYADISTAEACQLKSVVYQCQHHRRGDLLIKKGHLSNDVYAIAEGTVAQEIITEDGKTCIVEFLLPGDISSINSHLERTSGVTLKCLTGTTVINLQAVALEALLAESDSLRRAFSLMKLASERIQRERFVSVAARPGDFKLAHLLCELTLRTQHVLPDNAAVKPIPLTQPEIGAALGLSNVHVNRIIKGMEALNLLEVHSGTIYLTDWEALAETYCFDGTYITQQERLPNTRSTGSTDNG
ncbi:Crp/Fnr family transcriptional regulator (plasmid) [Marinobacter nanhaiticus D15-8W]|nr:Crp/Fnr family transcriptional regulator [Marinobacter nanhaiticus]BES73902.1 Crp/Fnr family transcriptional regulator [Marinobacter nanhaiticus D15-8W]